MKKNILLLIIFIGSILNSSYSQVTFTDFKKKTEKKELRIPLYDGATKLGDTCAYYNNGRSVNILSLFDSDYQMDNPFEEGFLYLKQFIGMEVYAPLRSSSLEPKQPYMEKYFTIVGLEEKTLENDYSGNPNINRHHELQFVLKDKSTGETIDVPPSAVKDEFILVSYFLKQKQMFEGKQFIFCDISGPTDANWSKYVREDYDCDGLVTDENILILKKSDRWNCRVSMFDYAQAQGKSNDHDYRIGYIFKNETQTFILVDRSERNNIVTPYQNIRIESRYYGYKMLLEDVYLKQKKEEDEAKKRIQSQERAKRKILYQVQPK